MTDTARGRDSIGVAVGSPVKDSARIRGVFRLEKYRSEADYLAGKSYEVAEAENAFTTVGLQAMGRLLTAQGGVTAFSNANAHTGVGDSTTAFAVGQTDLQAATNKLRKAMEATYPTDPSGGAYVFRSVYASGDANFAWAEMAVFNASSSGIMLCRVVSAQGTKTAGQVWTLTYTMTVT
jgi:hypothetical protein